MKILTWLWEQPGGRTTYTALHVNILADMVARNLSLPHSFACVTDLPEGIAPHIEIIEPPRDFENVRIPSWPEARPQCLRRLAMFRRDAGEIFGAESFLCLDLDCVVGASLDPMLARAGDFVMAVGTAAGRPYNGSAIYLRAGAKPKVYEDFTPARAAEAGRKFTGSDQAWIAHCLGTNEATWGEADGLVFHGLARSPDTVRRLMFFPGADKPWHRLHDSWVAEHYRRDPQGRCLILGYGSTLWKDVAEALEHGPYDGVIASPEAAEHWPGPLVAVAIDNNHAARLARLHGFQQVTWCGVKEGRAA